MVFPPVGQPRAGAGVVPPELSIQFRQRETQIFIGELIGALSALHSVREALFGHRVIHFVDNQGALSALIGGFSTDPDTSAIACMYQLIAASCSVRVWFEYVESEANIADGPSREGVAWGSSPLACAIDCSMERAALPDLSSLSLAPASLLGAFTVARETI